MARQKYKIPQINSGSSADIAFLLLIFFLITSSLDSRTGIYRKMNAIEAGEILKKRKDIQERNLLSFTINSDNQLIYNNEPIPFKDIKELSKTFIANPDNSDFLPEKESVDVPETGIFAVTTKHVISLEVSRKAKYQTYISVLNELTAAYNELRNETAQTLFNQSFKHLSPERQEAIRTIYPLQISEKEIDSAKEGERYE
ncbi:MAG: biopolymer transporter ExbD [Dysgonamonadaceae bacterium]|jgi:biopolymer transport protein ExbD|nr:biopolymer transporter ExbD [Dysgonamonadaceae bacterium]